ncbi:hypothetical protein N9934_04235 [Desulfosarcina sp.]|nr:hypothetical protein [Desulfosarcina sp.]
MSTIASQKRHARRNLEKIQHPERFYLKPPAGLHATCVWSANLEMPLPIRNHLCRNYLQCLAAAAGANCQFSCQGCELEYDQMASKPDDTEVAGVIALLLVVISNHLVEHAVTRVQMDLRTWQTIVAGELPRV